MDCSNHKNNPGTVLSPPAFHLNGPILSYLSIIIFKHNLLVSKLYVSQCLKKTIVYMQYLVGD